MTAPIIKLKAMYMITLPQMTLKQVHLLYIAVDVFLIPPSCVVGLFCYLLIIVIHCLNSLLNIMFSK